MSRVGLEPTTTWLKAMRSDQLSYRDKVVAEGFEPSKRDASDLKSLPFDQTRERYHITPCGNRTHNPQIRSLMRYPIAPMEQDFPHRDSNPGRLGENQLS